PGDPGSAKWLHEDERAWLTSELQSTQTGAAEEAHSTQKSWHRSALLATMNFAVAASASVLAVWLPPVARETLNLTITQVGLVSAPVYGLGVLGAILVGMWSDRVGRRLAFMAAFSGLAALALAFTAVSVVPMMSFIALVGSVVAIRCTGGVFFAAVSEGVRGKDRGHAFGLFIMFGSLGAFAGNWLFGILRETTGTFAGGIAGLAIMMTLTAIVALLASRIAPKGKT
ncbi:MAG: MFS transporter, partial [Paludibaculum sp.]